MAKKNEASVAPSTASEKIAALKAQREALLAEETALKTAAKAELEAEANKSKAAIAEADETLGDAIWRLIGKRKDRNVLLGKTVIAKGLITLLNPAGTTDENLIDVSELTTAIETRQALGSVSKVSSGTGTSRTRSTTGNVKAAQVRMMLHLLEHGACTRSALVDAVKGPNNTKFGGEFIGNIRDSNSDHPYSLIGRGWVTSREIAVDSGTRIVLELTEKGTEEAEKMKAAQTNGETK